MPFPSYYKSSEKFDDRYMSIKRKMISLEIQTMCSKDVTGHIVNSTRNSLFHFCYSSISNNNVSILQRLNSKKRLLLITERNHLAFSKITKMLPFLLWYGSA